MNLLNKVVVITGGNSGLGLSSAKLFVQHGAKVVIFGRNAATVGKAARDLGDNVLGVVGDVTNPDDLDRLAKETSTAFGNIDVLFANAGLGVFQGVAEITEADYDKQFDINVKGVFFTVQRLLPLLNKKASVILTGSAVHEKGVATGSLYFATKAAVRSLSRTLAAELAPLDIRVNTLSPGIVRTHFASNTNVDEASFEGFINMVEGSAPLGRAGTPEEIAQAALFLASEQSSYMTASDLVVDGGWMNV